MPVISKIRLTNIVYEGGQKRYNDELFVLEGNNTVFLLENGGGKTVLVQMVIQAILPGFKHANRKIRETLMLDSNAAHIAIEWIINENPKKYMVTAITLFVKNGELKTRKFINEYGLDDVSSIERIPFSLKSKSGEMRPASHSEMNDYYLQRKNTSIHGQVFDSLKEYYNYLETNYNISYKEWMNISKINAAEGGVDEFFNKCSTTSQLVNNLLLPTIEEGIEGENADLFSETFESHRQHLKQHKILNETIRQNKEIKSKIDYYVDMFKNYYEVSKIYDHERSVLKGVFQYAENELIEMQDKLIKLEDKKGELDTREIDLKNKEKSLEIALKKNEYEIIKEKHTDVKAELTKIEKEIADKMARINQLELAEKLKQEKDYIGKNNSLNEKLTALDSDGDYQKYIEDVECKKEMLAYAFNKEIDKFEDKIIRCKREQQFIDAQITSVKDKIAELESKKEEALKLKDVADGKCQYLEKEFVKIENSFIGWSKESDVTIERAKWKKKLEDLTLEKLQNDNAIEEKSSEIEELGEMKNRLTIEKEENAVNQKTVEMMLTTIELEEKKLCELYSEITGKIMPGNKVYRNARLVTGELEDEYASLTNRKEHMLLQEAKSNYENSLYKDNEFYMADPEFMNMVDGWKEQFGLLRQGTKYLGDHFDDEGSNLMFERYPYWAVSVVVLESEKESLMKKIDREAKKLLHPLFIITDEDVKNIKDNDYTFDKNNCIIPKTWQDNIHTDEFSNWKTDIQARLKDFTDERIVYEKQISNIEKIQNKLESFLLQYPYEDYMKHADELKDYISTSAEIKEQIVNCVNRTRERKNEIAEIRSKSDSILEEATFLESNLKLVVRYFEVREEIRELKKDIFHKEDDIKVIKKELREETKILQEQAEKKTDLREEEYRLSSDQNLLKYDPSFKEVQNLGSVENSETISVLKEQIQSLKDIIGANLAKREDLERQINDNKERLKDLSEDIAFLKESIKVEFSEEDYFFPIDGKEQIRSLKTQHTDYERKGKIMKNRQEEIKATMDKQEGAINSLVNTHITTFERVIIFDIGLDVVKSEVEDERNYLKDEKKEHSKKLRSLNNEKSKIDNVIIEMQKQNIRHKYLIEAIDSVGISEAITCDYIYNRLEVVRVLHEKADIIKNELEEKGNAKDKNKNKFKEFCSASISDIKLRNMTISALDNREDYEEIVEWQKKLKQHIAKTVEIAEYDLMQHDKEINKLIDRLYMYVKKIIQEMSIIQKKTRVKLKDVTKEIFLIKIPEWDEVDAKKIVREHLLWMTDRLKSDQYKIEGAEDIQKVKKDIKEWLSTKNLLMKIFRGKEIKVKCRKVTNDCMISSSPTDWSYAAKWSAGEKWSKNMTLFLGLQNYLAEKRHVDVNKSKRNRTVLLDNPFGKASSGHVLDPIFLIAEQLGFQLIAFTAHVEGKFISDYFPIVYSCKLRTSVDKNVQIMTKDTHINYAFLKDKNPISILRLEEGEQEQMELFSL
ncbi:MAG: hypothetical protein LR001_08075 [Clostridiales bacterium]|nr:hypothetical protein [Clostridiales bacterium]